MDQYDIVSLQDPTSEDTSNFAFIVYTLFDSGDVFLSRVDLKTGEVKTSRIDFNDQIARSISRIRCT